jgi:DNA polymerase-3 subunit epsilon
MGSQSQLHCQNPMREIVLDTETTGLDARNGDRLIEIGCVEIVNRYPTGREFHRFLNPETKRVHPDAFAVHGISTDFLRDKPLFNAEVDAFLDFLGEDTLVIHNAPFDIGFINMELERIGRPILPMTRVVDTLPLARRKHPGAPATLDALCKRYSIDTSERTKHGAIVDSLLLAQVYIELLGERQASLVLATNGTGENGPLVRTGSRATYMARQRPSPLSSRLSDADLQAHAAYIETLASNPVWKRTLN